MTATMRPKHTVTDEFSGLDAVAQAGLVKQGKVSALELVDTTIQRIEAVNPSINAVVTEAFD